MSRSFFSLPTMSPPPTIAWSWSSPNRPNNIHNKVMKREGTQLLDDSRSHKILLKVTDLASSWLASIMNGVEIMPTFHLTLITFGLYRTCPCSSSFPVTLIVVDQTVDASTRNALVCIIVWIKNDGTRRKADFQNNSKLLVSGSDTFFLAQTSDRPVGLFNHTSVGLSLVATCERFPFAILWFLRLSTFFNYFNHINLFQTDPLVNLLWDIHFIGLDHTYPKPHYMP